VRRHEIEEPGLTSDLRDGRSAAATLARLAESEARLQLAQEVGGVGTYEIRSTTGETLWSDQLYALYQRDPALGPPSREEWPTLVHPDDLHRVRGALPADARAGDVLETEFRIRLPSGGYRWLATRARVFPDEQGRPTRFVGVNIDVTALKEAEGRLRLATEGTGVGTYDIDLATGEGIWSAAAFAMLGLPAPPDGRATYDTWRARIHPDDLARVEEAHGAAALTEDPWSCEYRIIRHDSGETRWLRNHGRFLHEAGRAVRSSGIVADITEAKRSEERQRLLMLEVDHRARNALALVQAVVRLSRDSGDFAEVVEGRVDALARVHGMLADNAWSGVAFGDLVRGEADADAPRVVVAGGGVTVPPYMAQPLGLALHELFVRSRRSGALAAPVGRLVLEAREADGLEIRWRETPPPHDDEGDPLGARLVRQIVERQLGGRLADRSTPRQCEIGFELPLRPVG